MKKLDMQSESYRYDFAWSKIERSGRTACIGQLSIILTGDKLRENAASARQETDPKLENALLLYN